MSSAAKKLTSPLESSHDIKQPLFESLAKKIYHIAGIHMPYNEKNVALMNNRLTRLMRSENIKSLEDLNRLLIQPTEELQREFVSSLTTNKTDFFREEAHFDFLKKQLPALLKKPEVRIWSSACSLGSEPYTVALIAQEMVSPFERQRFKILGTDIDHDVLMRAVQARYTTLELEGLHPGYLQKYFSKVSSDLYELNSDIAKMVHFSEFNLMNHSYRFQKKFDVVFCRNVLIYFDKDTTDRVVDLLVSNLEVKGHLIIGHSEAGVIRHPCLKSLGHSIFEKVRN